MTSAAAGRVARAFLRVVAAAAILGAVLYVAAPHDLGGRLAHAARWPLVLGLAATLTAYVVGAERLAVLARSQGIAVGLREVTQLSLAGVFYGLFLPAGNATGLAVRLWRLAGADRRIGPALFALAIDRVVATMALGLVGLVFWSVDRPAASPIAGAVLAVTLLVAAAGCAMLVSRTAAHALERRADLPIVGKLLRASAGSVLGLRGLGARRLCGLALLSILAHLVGIAGWLAIARAAGLDLPLVTIAWVRCAIVAVTLVPISIAGLGLREGAMLVLLGPLGVADGDALAYSLLISTVTVVGVGLVGGALEAARVVRRRSPDRTAP